MISRPERDRQRDAVDLHRVQCDVQTGDQPSQQQPGGHGDADPDRQQPVQHRQLSDDGGSGRLAGERSAQQHDVGAVAVSVSAVPPQQTHRRRCGARARGWCRRFGVGEHGVDLPLLTGGSGDPDLVLGGEAAGRADLLLGEQSLVGEPGDLGVHGVAGLDLDAEVVDGAALAGVFDQHQLQRRFGDREVRVTRLDLGRLRCRTAWSRTRSPRRGHRR